MFHVRFCAGGIGGLRSAGSFTDSLDKTTFEGTAVAGVSALAVTRPSRALALADNLGTTPPHRR
ncbi:hypothetical protein [Nonomuraea polychroma]|uniref:hypothetical protein n=1 Tax=Nonomuraea polychroma TaxID=46176 RepID=UPI000FDF0B6B|nr:hypothetical protein [Nonomuraea polychroma]